jgi:Zn-dependent protease/CBS domain-containing protein
VSETGPPRRPAAVTAVRLGSVFGVPIIVQPIWFLLVVVLAFGVEPQLRGQVPGMSTGTGYAVSLALVLLLYGSVLVHEISHVAVARALGMHVRRIVLQFFGGVSEVVEEHPGQPGREYLVAAVGPLTSVLLGGVGLALVPAFEPGTVPRLLAEEFSFTNLVVGAFNTLPGLPLDGGRILRSLLWQLTHDKDRGTLAAGWVGRGLAVALALSAVSHASVFRSSQASDIYLLILAAYLWAAASQQIGLARVKGVLPSLDVRALTRRALPVTEAVRRAHDSGARALVVVDGNGRPSGLVSEAAVTALPPQRQPWVSVSDLARPMVSGLVLRTDMTGPMLVDAVRENPASEYLVVDSHGLVCGVLARTDLVAALQAAGVR